MKLMEKMKQKRLGNKGFSLVELIIVIAMMAVLIGIVGTQVVPYLNRAREAKDLQILNSFSTAAVSAYSLRADEFKSDMIIKDVLTDGSAGSGGSTGGSADTTLRKNVTEDIHELTGYKNIDELQPDMSSEKGSEIDQIKISFNLTKGIVTVEAYAGNKPILEPVESKIGKKK